MTGFKTQESIDSLKKNVDPILKRAVSPESRFPLNGVLSGITNEKETVYLEAKGVSDGQNQTPLGKNTVFNLWSTTKAITSTALLQLYDKGLVELDEPVKKYYPEISRYQIIKGRNEDGTPILERPKNDVTLRHLLTHTAGFGYSFFHKEYKEEQELSQQPDIFNTTEETFDHLFLLFEPGTQWAYGYNICIAGFVLEKVTGQKLGDYLQEHIFGPAKMTSTTFKVPLDKDVLTLDIRLADGNLQPFKNQPDPQPDFHMGGHGAFGTVEDYLKFIRVWLNQGKTAEGVQIISRDTWKLAVSNNLPSGLHVTGLTSQAPDMTVLAPEQPGDPDHWGLGFCINNNALPTGRPKGSIFWSGLANLYFWVDLENGIGGYYASQVFPYGDGSALNALEIEAAAYRVLSGAV